MPTIILVQMFMASDIKEIAPWFEREPIVYNRKVPKRKGPKLDPPAELDIDPLSGNVVRKELK